MSQLKARVTAPRSAVLWYWMNQNGIDRDAWSVACDLAEDEGLCGPQMIHRPEGQSKLYQPCCIDSVPQQVWEVLRDRCYHEWIDFIRPRHVGVPRACWELQTVLCVFGFLNLQYRVHTDTLNRMIELEINTHA